jgi:hypothetical protein
MYHAPPIRAAIDDWQARIRDENERFLAQLRTLHAEGVMTRKDYEYFSEPVVERVFSDRVDGRLAEQLEELNDLAWGQLDG